MLSKHLTFPSLHSLKVFPLSSPVYSFCKGGTLNRGGNLPKKVFKVGFDPLQSNSSSEGFEEPIR